MLGNPHTWKTTYFTNAGETLSGKVLGQTASDIEERAAISQSKMGLGYQFRMRINPLINGITPVHRNTKGEVELDYLTSYQNVLWPFMIQGEISHFYDPSTRDEDKNKVAKVDEFLKPYRAHKTILIPFWLLRTQAESDRLFREGFANGWPVEFYER
jgi:hypothetical protein